LEQSFYRTDALSVAQPTASLNEWMTTTTA